MTRNGVPWLRSFVALSLVGASVSSCGTEAVPPLDNTDRTSPPDNTNERDGGASQATSSSSAAATGSPRVCTPPTFHDDSPALPFERLTATVVDEEGNPVQNILAQACGTNVCLQSKTNAEGRVTITEAAEISKLAFKYGDGLRYAQIVVQAAEGERHDLGTQTTLRLPEEDTNNRFEAGATVESSGARLTLDADATVKLDRLSYPDAEQHVFVAREFERAVLPPSIEAREFDAVWVLGPLKTSFCPSAALSLPNTAKFPAGSVVELHLLVNDIEGHFAPYAEWGKVGEATVTSDGARIETDPHSGLPELGIVGLRLAVDAKD